MTTSYAVQGREIALDVDETAIAVRFRSASCRRDRALASEGPELAPFSERFELPKERYTVLQLSQGKTGALGEASDRLSQHPAVERVAPVFRMGEKQAVATERVMFGLKPGHDDLAAVLAEHGLELLERYGEGEAMARAPAGANPIEVARQLGHDARIGYAEPDFVLFGHHLARRPKGAAMQSMAQRNLRHTAPLMREQYAIYITETDVAHTRMAGSPDVRIAILDEGVDPRHPDLAAAIVGTYDATDDSPSQATHAWNSHGTACAGLAAALRGDGEGIIGIGGGCSILAVRIAYSREPNGRYVSCNSWIRRAIDWSVENGVDVLSNSWGGGVYSQAIVNAFKRARRDGRDGLGAVVVVSAGNDSAPVDFPGCIPDVLTVSASNEYDEFKTRTSRDGEHWWGSNFGPQVNVAAPGVHNLTTDVWGIEGCYGSDYIDFNGTSSATPLVAGACALLLSADTSLDEATIREIIEETADKVGQFPYTNGRNDQMGSGRLNVRRALDRVLGDKIARIKLSTAPVVLVNLAEDGSPYPLPAA